MRESEREKEREGWNRVSRRRWADLEDRGMMFVFVFPLRSGTKSEERDTFRGDHRPSSRFIFTDYRTLDDCKLECNSSSADLSSVSGPPLSATDSFCVNECRASSFSVRWTFSLVNRTNILNYNSALFLWVSLSLRRAASHSVVCHRFCNSFGIPFRPRVTRK